MIRLVILGSTGSIGSQALDIVRANRDRIEVAALAAGKNAAQMERDIREFMPKAVCLYDEEAARNLRLSISDLDVRVLCGIEGLKEIAAMPEADLVLSAIVGMIGIEPTLAAIKARRKVALANKESLVAAGHIIMKAAEENGVQILPVDSEHSAIFQSLQGAFESGSPESRVEKILLTASGGPFRGLKPADLNEITAEAALKHPNWSMGPKVTIDSSTLANKGLEVMEAHWLFNVPYEKIEVLIHPESIVHSGVQFIDGAVICQMGVPDMHLPIQYAFFYPQREFLDRKRLDLFEIGHLTFEKPDYETFKPLSLAFKAAKAGGSLPSVFNAANEAAVKEFLEGKIRYLEIAERIERAMDRTLFIKDPTLEEVFQAAAAAYEEAMR